MKQLLFKTSCVIMVLLTSSLSIVSTYSHATTSGGTSSSSSASSSSSSSAASASRGSTSSSTSMSRSSAINASRNAQQSSQRAAQQATKSSRVTATKNKGQRPYDSSAPYSSQYIATTYYNNWLFYYIFAHSFLNQHEKKNSVDAQFNMLKQQMKPHEKLYTVTVKTKQGKRVVVVPKKQYDKIEKGKHIKVKNGVVQ